MSGWPIVAGIVVGLLAIAAVLVFVRARGGSAIDRITGGDR